MDSGWVSALSTAFIVALALGLGIVLCAVAAPDLLWRVTRPHVRSLRCPWGGVDVTAGFQDDLLTGRPVDVRWCTAFIPAAAVRCGRLCVADPAVLRRPAERRA